jgi:hypothetical protein
MRFFAVRPLAYGTLPGQQSFTIIGERYLFQHRVYFTLAVSIARPGEPLGGGGGGGFNPSQTPGTLAYTAMVGCVPHPYAVVFALLRASSDAVVARSGTNTTVLQHVSIPAVLHARGVLVYARLPGPPSEVIVERPDGRRVRDDKLGRGRCAPGMLLVLQPQAQPRAR